MKKSQKGMALALAVCFVLVFSIMTLPIMHRYAVSVKNQVNLNSYDQTLFYAEAAHEKAFFDTRAPDSMTGGTKWQNIADITSNVIFNKYGLSGLTASGGVYKVKMADKTILVKIETTYQ